MGLRVLTRPNPDKLPEIYRTLGTDYAERVLPSIIQVGFRIPARANMLVRAGCRGMLLTPGHDWRFSGAGDGGTWQAYLPACGSEATHRHPRLLRSFVMCYRVDLMKHAFTADYAWFYIMLLQETLKSVIAQYNASQLLTQREVRWEGSGREAE